MKRFTAGMIIAGAMLVLAASNGWAQNTTAGNAVRDQHIGQQVTGFLSSTALERWYLYQVRVGRSYCMEIGAEEFEANTGPHIADPVGTVYQSDATTVIGSSDDTGQEPDSYRGSRVCFISTQTLVYVKITPFSSTAGHYYTMRFVETSLWGSWFFIGGDYNSFVLLRNTTSEAVNYTVTWRNPAGTITGTTSGTVVPNGGLGLNARTFVINPTVNVNGTVEIYHSGSPEALVGQVTSLSATTGLGYDSNLFQRKAW